MRSHDFNVGEPERTVRMNRYYDYTEEMEYNARQGTEMVTSLLNRCDRFFDVFFAFLALVFGALRKSEVRKALRCAAVAICFFCFIGLIGGIEQGLVTVGLGVVAGLLLIFIEILCLK